MTRRSYYLLVPLPMTHATLTTKLFPQSCATKPNSKQTHLKKQTEILEELARLFAHKGKLQHCNLMERAQDSCSSHVYPFQASFSQPLTPPCFDLVEMVSSTSLLHKSSLQSTDGKCCTCNRTSLFSSKSLRPQKAIKGLRVKWDSCSRAPF